jgi:hypothetical protein
MPSSISAPVGKKVSLFKKEITEKRSGEEIETSPSPFKGDVIENSTPAKPVVRDVVCNTSGFPSTKLGSRFSLGAPKRSGPAKVAESGRDKMQSSATVSPPEHTAIRDKDVEDNDFQQENLRTVMHMSPEEVAQSMEELASLFPPSTLEFLKKRGEQKLGVPVSSQPSSASNTPTKNSHGIPGPASSSRVVGEGTRDKERGVLGCIFDDVNDTDSGYIARTEDELWRRVQSAPETVQKALQWTLCDDDFDDDMDAAELELTPQQSALGDQTAPTASSHVTGKGAPATNSLKAKVAALSTKPQAIQSRRSLRFDLQGCLVVASSIKGVGSGALHMQEYEGQWSEVFAPSFVGRLLNSTSTSTPSQSQVSDGIACKEQSVCESVGALSIICARTMISCGFVVVVGNRFEDGPIDSAKELELNYTPPELEHHEFDQGAPGYSLKEVCEVGSNCIIHYLLHRILYIYFIN